MNEWSVVTLPWRQGSQVLSRAFAVVPACCKQTKLNQLDPLQLRNKFKGCISKPKDIRENIRKEFFGTWNPSLAAVVSESAHTPP